MPKRIFVDTAFVIALVNHKDRYHQQASELASRFDGYPLLVTDAVLLEIGTALSRGFKEQSVAIIEQFLVTTDVQLVHLTPQLFKQAFEMYKKYHDKEWSLIDCVSFVVMRAKGVNQALTFDHHFEQAGFVALMRENAP